MTDEQTHITELPATIVWPNETWREIHVEGDKIAEQVRQTACQTATRAAQTERKTAEAATA